MPQKPVYSRYPLMDLTQCGLSRGMARAEAGELIPLYRRLNTMTDNPAVWEGAFSLACLLSDDPLSEPAGQAIRAALGETEDGAFPLARDAQLGAARAALAVYEYSANRDVLKRLAQWCRWLETEWESLAARRWIRIQPADLMDFLTRFYRITGLKAVLRLCSRVRSAAVDWTTALHRFRQRNPLDAEEAEREIRRLLAQEEYREVDFFQMQYLSNDAEILADAVRYTACAAAYSGNGQELTAGQKGWEYLRKYHGAVCGGTTANILLGGNGSSQGIHAAATAAWAEAMIAQSLNGKNIWAMNALVRIVYNALADCLKHSEEGAFRHVNTTGTGEGAGCFDPEPAAEIRTAARLARAAAAVWQHAVCTGPDGVYINYLLPGRYYVSALGQSAVFQTDGSTLHIRCRSAFEMSLNLFRAETETAEISVHSGEKEDTLPPDEGGEQGVYVRIRKVWDNLDTVALHQENRIYTESTAHQGVCVMIRNRLMSLNITEAEYRYAVCGDPQMKNGQVFVPLKRIPRWPARGGIPADIPVLPTGTGEVFLTPLTPYANTKGRITVFPREGGYV